SRRGGAGHEARRIPPTPRRRDRGRPRAGRKHERDVLTMPRRFTELGPLVRFAKLRALRGLYDGKVNPRNMALMRACTHLYAVAPDVSACLIYTRDVGHHSNGWWKNPDYERCRHLSISFSVHPTG